MKQQTSLIEGNIHSTMLSFALPFLLANLLQAFYGAADLMIVGQFSDSANLSAVATGSQIMQTVTSIVAGLTTGGTVLIGQYFGAGRDNDVLETMGTMLTLFGLFAIMLTGIMVLTVNPIISLMQTPPEAFEQTKQYVFICSFGIIFIFGYNAISAMLRGLGDSRNPLIFIAIACVCNIIGDLILVGGVHMGALGAAYATAASQGISMILSIVLLKRKRFIFNFNFDNLRLYKQKVKNLLKIGAPISLQESLVMISFLFITAIANKMGVAESAAVGVIEKMNVFTMLPPMAISAAIATMVAQNMGADKPERAKKCLYAGMLFSLIFGIIFFIVLEFAPEFSMEIFTRDPGVIGAGTLYLRAYSIDCALVCFTFCLNAFFNGCGHTAFSMINNISATVLIRVPASYLLSIAAGATLFEIGIATPLASVASMIVGFLYLKTGRWRKINLV